MHDLLIVLIYLSHISVVYSGQPLIMVPDHRATMRQESEPQQGARHARVMAAREGPIVVVHRGAWEFAPENTLAAIQAALDLGATAVEIDFRKTADGVIVLFHDERIERMFDGVGNIRDYLYEELLLHSFRSTSSMAVHHERIPTLPEVLSLARERAALLHLDIKDGAIDRELLDAIRAAAMLDQVVTYNDYNSDAFNAAKVTRLSFKGSLMEEGQDTDPIAIARMLMRPGNLVIVDDPRATLGELGKKPQSVSLAVSPGSFPQMTPPTHELLESVLQGSASEIPPRLAAVRLLIYWPEHFARLAPNLTLHASAEIRRAMAWNMGMLAKHRPELVSNDVRNELLRLLGDQESSVRAEAAVACGRARITEAVPQIVALLAARPADLDQWTDHAGRLDERRVMIEARCRYAFALGLLGASQPSVVDVLIDAVLHRAIHQDVMLVGVDGAMAAFALGKLHAGEAVAPLRNALLRDDSTLSQLGETATAVDVSATPSAWWDFHIRSFILPALAEINTDSSLAVLREVIGIGADGRHGPISPDVCAQAAQALTHIERSDTLSLIKQLLCDSEPQARRSAVLACLRRSDPQYRQLLEAKAPWAVPWWDAQHL